MLSAQRWYWAAMTAFYMFINVTNRGAGMRRAVERTIGTAGGIAAGLMLSYILPHRPMLELVLLFPVLFVGFWMLKSSYAVMTVMITIMLALLYEMMGMLTFDLLLLRLGETFIGAAIAVGAMYFVLPTTTSDAVDKVFEQYFDAVDDMLSALSDSRVGAISETGDPIDAVRNLSRALGALETTIRPVISAVPGRRARQLRQELVLSLTIRYALHRLLARVVFHTTPLDAPALHARAEKVQQTLRMQRAGAPADVSASTPAYAATPETAALSRVEALLRTLIRSRLQNATPLSLAPQSQTSGTQ
jgi:uncharacterized membrane protein YccC